MSSFWIVNVNSMNVNVPSMDVNVNAMDNLHDYTWLGKKCSTISFLCMSTAAVIWSAPFLLSLYQSEVLSYSYLSASHINTPYQ